MRLTRRTAFSPPVDLELLVLDDGSHLWLCLIAADDLAIKRVWSAGRDQAVDAAVELVVDTVTEGVRSGQSLVAASQCWPEGWDLLTGVPAAVERWVADPERWAARIDDVGATDTLVAFLEEAPALVGASSVALRIDAGAVETVYLERRGAHLVVGDSGETWETISGLPDEHRPWSDEVVAELARPFEVDVVRDGDEDGERVALERRVGTDPVAEVVRALARLVERVYAAHVLDAEP